MLTIETRYKETLFDMNNVWITWIRDYSLCAPTRRYFLTATKPTKNKIRSLKKKFYMDK